MTVQFAIAPPAASSVTRRARYNPRRDVLDEVLAGLLWMSMDLPADMGLEEINASAHRLVSLILAGADEAGVAAWLDSLQRQQLCVPARPGQLRGLARACLLAANAY